MIRLIKYKSKTYLLMLRKMIDHIPSESCLVMAYSNAQLYVDRLKVRSTFLASQTRHTQLVVSPGWVDECVLHEKPAT